MIMKYNMIKDVVLFGLVVISIGIAGNTYLNSNNSIEDSVVLNTENISALAEISNKMSELQVKDTILFGEIAHKIEQIKSDVSSVDLAQVEARLMVQENAIQALSQKVSDVPTHESTRKSFNLVLLDINSIRQEVFGTNDIIYITGDAGATYQASVTIKIRDDFGTIVYGKDLGIAQVGKFTTAYVVPSDALSGRYTVTITDGTTLDSINFVLR